MAGRDTSKEAQPADSDVGGLFVLGGHPLVGSGRPFTLGVASGFVIDGDKIMYFPPWLSGPQRRQCATGLSPSVSQHPCGFWHCLIDWVGVCPPPLLYKGRESVVLYINNYSNPHGCWASAGDRSVSANASCREIAWRRWGKNSISRAVAGVRCSGPALAAGGAP